MTIEPMISISTACLTEETRALLEEDDGMAAIDFGVAVIPNKDSSNYFFGYFVSTDTFEDLLEKKAPKDLKRCIERAKNMGFAWIRFDRDEPYDAADGLPNYE